MVEFATQRRLYNLCDPDETLSPGDATLRGMAVRHVPAEDGPGSGA